MSLTTPLRQRDFRLLWSGMSVSLLGDGIFLIAIAWQAYALDNQPSSLAYVGVALSAPQVALLPVAGALCDRLRRQLVLFWSDVVRAATVGALAVVTATGTTHLWQLYLAGSVLGSAAAFASPAFDALIPELVPGDDLDRANALEQFVRPATLQLAGPALGGVVVATVHTAGALGIDAATFVYSAYCISRMAPIHKPVAHGDGGNLRREIREGLHYVRKRVWLWGTFLSATFTYLLFIGPTQVLLPYIIRNEMHQGASSYGVVLAAGGVGALIGAVAMGALRAGRRGMTWVYVCWTIATFVVAGYGLATRVWELVLVSLVLNGAEVMGAVVWVTLKQRRVVNSMLGRVSSIDWFVSTALLPLSYAITVPVSRALGAGTTLVVAGTAGAAVTLGFLLLPGMRAEPSGAESGQPAVAGTPTG